MRGDLQRHETLVVQRDAAIASLRDEACTQWASGWLAFQRKGANAYPGLDLNFDIPSDEEAEESFSSDCSGEPNTPGEIRSPSLWDPFPGLTRFGGSEPSPRCPIITKSLKIQSLRKRF